MSAYYNEFDPFAAAWLRELIKAGHIAPGDVDERSIKDVKADDLRGYTQCHFFAGIGVWSHALRSAGWSDERPVWSGSCPCQPFSAAGKGGGFDDERHLWPDFFRLIAECRPDVVLGEQVASKDGLGWLDLVYADLEGADYAVGAVDTCAAGFGAPHIRQRLYWTGTRLADTESAGKQRELGNAQRAGRQGVWAQQERPEHDRSSADGGLAVEQDGRLVDCSSTDRPGPTNGLWRDADWLGCRDGKWRPVEPGTFPLAHGAAARVGRLRGYGNAIVAPQAQAFVEAVMSCS
jgi:DNA (cytosine-5)-methyltransferase 1